VSADATAHAAYPKSASSRSIGLISMASYMADLSSAIEPIKKK